MKYYHSVTLFLLLSIVIISCSGEENTKQKPEHESSKVKALSENENKELWLNFPVYEESKLEETKECHGKWKNCEECEHKIYSTNDDPSLVCNYYKEELQIRGWMKITYQFYPEGSCLATWMKDETRVLFNTAKRRSDNKTVFSITIGRDCP